MTNGGRPVGALDIGSNTVRILVARPSAGGLDILLDLGDYASLGEGVDRTGLLQEENQKRALDAVTRFVQQARGMGADPITAVATSAIRDARNGPEFIERIKNATGVEPQIISGDREAELTAIGATLGRPTSSETVVVDLGGGSAEVIAMQGTTIEWGKSLQIGSRRLTERYIGSDPPTAEQLENVAAHVRSQLEELPPASPQQGIFVGGTANVIPRVLGLPGPPAALSGPDLDRLLKVMQFFTASGLTQEFGLPPERAEVLAAGAATLTALARFYGLDAVTIPGTGIREGMIIDLLGAQDRR